MPGGGETRARLNGRRRLTLRTPQPSHGNGSAEDELAGRLSQLVTEGRYATRTEAVQEVIAELLAREDRRRVDRAIVAGYRPCRPVRRRRSGPRPPGASSSPRSPGEPRPG